MSLTPIQAVDAIYGIFAEAWTPTGLPMHFEDAASERSSEESAWSVVYVRHASGFQSALSGTTGKRKFARLGYFTAQIFSPVAQGLQECRTLAKVVSDAFEGSSAPGGLWFRNVRMNEVGRDGEYFQINVIAEFRYDEIR